MSPTSKSGIQTSADGSSYIPASTRADGSTRKEIRVRPGYRPPEDVETYKNRSAEAWKTRGSGGVPGAEVAEKSGEGEETKSKNAKRRDAAKRKKEAESEVTNASNEGLISAIGKVTISDPNKQLPDDSNANADDEAERQKKIRNQLKKLRAVRELKEKRSNGEKLSHDQLMKIGKEDELLRDLKKLDYDGPEMEVNSDSKINAEESIG